MAESFEDHLAALEGAVARLESGETTLAEALEVYEGAVRSLKACHGILARAEARVQALAEDGTEEDLPDG